MPHRRHSLMVFAASIALSIALSAASGDGSQDEGPTSKPAEKPAASPDQPQPPRPELAGPNRWYVREYLFGRDWFTQHIPLWTEVMKPLKGRPDVRYLEIGLYEGRSAIWMLDNVLTHESARLTGIDLFASPAIEDRWRKNVTRAGAQEKVTTLVGFSDEMLRPLPFDTYDVIYVDGSHLAKDCLADALLSWKLLKVGGLLIFDDYGLRAGFPPELRPATAIDAFITAHRSVLDEVHRGHQVIVRKRENPCPFKRADCCRLGRYLFFWWDGALADAETGEPIAVTEGESELLRELVRSRPAGRVAFEVTDELRAQPGFLALCKRLALEL